MPEANLPVHGLTTSQIESKVGGLTKLDGESKRVSVGLICLGF